MILGQIFDCFADDTSLFIIVDDPMTAAGCINADLGKISAWASTWLVTFSPTKLLEGTVLIQSS